MAIAPPLWKRPRPPGRRTPLTEAQRAWARATAALHGRRYPNLVDNVAAARQPPDVAAPTAAPMATPVAPRRRR